MKTPVVFLVFNRPDTTQRVFETIRQARPPKLLVVADGPRPDHPDDPEKCAAVRAIIDTVDWDCEVLKNYSETNLGCKTRVSSGLDWVFEEVAEAIILEDDCLPDLTFFPFCEELLDRYRDDKRIMVISGDNFQFGRKRTEYSYYFSIYNHCWGWATWRRAWQYYDVEMKLWGEIKNGNWLYDILQDYWAVKYWSQQFEKTYQLKINSWAYRWTLSCWLQSGLTILPNTNLVSNIGFDLESTHTRNKSSLYSNLQTKSLQFPLTHPLFIICDKKADAFTQRKKFGMLARGWRKINDILLGI